MKSSVRIIVKGRVQGVGYRWVAVNAASEFGINGYVQNLFNGDVEVYAEGDDSQLLLFINKLREGPPFSNVTDIITDYGSFTDSFKEFKVKY
jgi:acylphosphatase